MQHELEQHDWNCPADDFWDFMPAKAAYDDDFFFWPKCDLCKAIFPEGSSFLAPNNASHIISQRNNDAMFNICTGCFSGHTYHPKWKYLSDLQDEGRFPDERSVETTSVFGFFFAICDARVYHGLNLYPHNIYHLTDEGKAALFPASKAKKAISQ